MNNLYWNFNGFDQASHYSRMVPKSTLRNGVGGSLLLVSVSYLLPIMIATGATDLEQDEWTNGSFATAGTMIGGEWLGESRYPISGAHPVSRAGGGGHSGSIG